jgi:hypothetical protein
MHIYAHICTQMLQNTGYMAKVLKMVHAALDIDAFISSANTRGSNSNRSIGGECESQTVTPDSVPVGGENSDSDTDVDMEGGDTGSGVSAGAGTGASGGAEGGLAHEEDGSRGRERERADSMDIDAELGALATGKYESGYNQDEEEEDEDGVLIGPPIAAAYLPVNAIKCDTGGSGSSTNVLKKGSNNSIYSSSNSHSNAGNSRLPETYTPIDAMCFLRELFAMTRFLQVERRYVLFCYLPQTYFSSEEH